METVDEQISAGGAGGKGKESCCGIQGQLRQSSLTQK
jgi:hypothetical protein